MFRYFLTPPKTMFWTVGVAWILIATLLRWTGASGSLQTWLAVIVITAVMASTARQWPAMHQLDVPARLWRRDGILTAATIAGVAAVLIGASSVLRQRVNPLYASTDLFLQTQAAAFGTDGDMSWISDELPLQNWQSALWTVVILFVVFFAFLVFTLGQHSLWLMLGGLVVSALILQGITVAMQWSLYLGDGALNAAMVALAALPLIVVGLLPVPRKA